MFKNNIKLIIGILLMGFIISACNSSSKGEEGGHDEHGDHDEHGGEEGTVSLSEQQVEAIGLNLVQLEKRNMNISVQAQGKLELAPQDKADISPIMGGVVKKINVFEGDKVKKGQILAVLEHPDFIQLQQDYVTNLHTLEYQEQEYARQKRLYEEKVGSGKAFQKITAEYNTSKSTLAALKAKLQMLGLNVKGITDGKIYQTVNIFSPVNGIVSLVETNVGAYIEPLTKAFEIVNNDKVHADFMIYEKDINKVKVGQKIYFTTSSLSGEEMEGEIYAISPAFEENPKAIHVHAKIITKNKALIPGMYIHGRITANNILTEVLPEHAVVVEEEKAYIFVKKPGEEAHGHDHEKENTEKEKDNHDEHATEEHGHDEDEGGKWTFEMVEVLTGINDSGFIEIKLLSPLPEGAKIAGNGAYYLLAEMGKGETEHSH